MRMIKTNNQRRRESKKHWRRWQSMSAQFESHRNSVFWLESELKNRDEGAIRSQITFIQSQLREYSACSVVHVAIDLLAETRAWTFEDVQSIPWLTLLVVKWVMQDHACPLYRGREMTRRDLDSFRQKIWDLTGVAKAEAPNANAMLRSIVPVQIEFQRRSPWGFMRWASLTARLPAEHPSRQQFVRELQLSPEEFIDACLIVQALVREAGHKIGKERLAGIPMPHASAVERLLSLLGSDFLGLRTTLAAKRQSTVTSSWELFEFPFAKNLPFLLMPSGDCHIWHPAMYERAMEDAAHLILTPLKGEYTQAFSRVFEDYVVELAKEAWSGLIDESAWKQVMGHNAVAVEAIVPFGSVNVFIESKMSLFHDAAIIDDSPEKLVGRLERIIEAVQQGWKASQLLRTRPREFPRRAQADEEFLLVVVSRELHIGGGLALRRLLPQGVMEHDDDALANRLPLENIFVLSIESFEHLQGIVRDQSIDIAVLLRAAAAANRNSSTSAMYFDDHLKSFAKAGWPAVGIFQAQFEAASNRLERVPG